MNRILLLNNPFLYASAEEPGDPGSSAGGGDPTNTSTGQTENGSEETAEPADYGFGEPPTEGGDSGGSAAATTNTNSENKDEIYELTFGEDFAGGDELKNLLTEQAKTSGLPSDKASQFLGNVISKIRDAEVAELKASDAKLKEDWGKDYEANMKTAKAFAHKVASKAGLKMEDMAVFASPNGYRILNALAGTFEEGGIVGAGNGTKVNPDDEAKRMLSDPSHPLHDAILNPAHPRHKEANEQYNRLVGIIQD